MRISMGKLGFLGALLLAGCGHCGDAGDTAAGPAQVAPEAEAEGKPAESAQGDEPTKAEADAEGDSIETAAEPAKEDRECDRSIPWEERKQCWADKGIWPHAPAMTEAEWDALDIQNATLEEVQALIPRAVTGDVCAALNNTAEKDKWKRWSPALPVELALGIVVVEGDGSYQKVADYYESQNTRAASKGLVKCDSRTVYWAPGAVSAEALAERIEALGGLKVVESQGFPFPGVHALANECIKGVMWLKRCLLELRKTQLMYCPGSGYERPDDFRELCPRVATFLSSNL